MGVETLTGSQFPIPAYAFVDNVGNILQEKQWGKCLRDGPVNLVGGGEGGGVEE